MVVIPICLVCNSSAFHPHLTSSTLWMLLRCTEIVFRHWVTHRNISRSIFPGSMISIRFRPCAPTKCVLGLNLVVILFIKSETDLKFRVLKLLFNLVICSFIFLRFFCLQILPAGHVTSTYLFRSVFMDRFSLMACWSSLSYHSFLLHCSSYRMVFSAAVIITSLSWLHFTSMLSVLMSVSVWTIYYSIAPT